jgi:hypothetical protein
MISILCAKKNSLYKTIPGIDVWDEDRDAYFFTGSNPVITHAPCAQWSRMRNFAKDDPDQKELAYFCLTKIIRNGGIFEHPAGSSFFKQAGLTKNIYSVDQSWWGFPAVKRTYLFFHECRPLSFPFPSETPSKIVNTQLRKNGSRHKKQDQFKSSRMIPKSMNSTTVLPFAKYLIDCINA